jgi:hypothetical protein
VKGCSGYNRGMENKEDENGRTKWTIHFGCFRYAKAGEEINGLG